MSGEYSIFYSKILRMNNNFTLERDDGTLSHFSFINTLMLSKIVKCFNHRKDFEKRLSEKLSHIEKIDYELSWLTIDKDPNADDTVAFLTCRDNTHHMRCIRELDGFQYAGKYISCKPNGFSTERYNRSLRFNTSFQRSAVKRWNNEHYETTELNVQRLPSMADNNNNNNTSKQLFTSHYNASANKRYIQCDNIASTSSSSNNETLKIYDKKEPSPSGSETSKASSQQSKKRRVDHNSSCDVQTLGQVDHGAQVKQVTAAIQTSKLITVDASTETVKYVNTGTDSMPAPSTSNVRIQANIKQTSSVMVQTSASLENLNLGDNYDEKKLDFYS
jgi:hypothetical protein